MGLDAIVSLIWGIKLTPEQLVPFLKLHSKRLRKEIEESNDPVNFAKNTLLGDPVPFIINKKYSIIRLISRIGDLKPKTSFFFQIGTEIDSIHFSDDSGDIETHEVPLADDINEFYQFIKNNDLPGADMEIALWSIPWVSY